MRLHSVFSLLAACLAFSSSAVLAAPLARAAAAKSASTRAVALKSSTRAPSSSGAKASGVIGGLLGNLFPAGSRNPWTTSPASSKALHLSDSTFKPTNVLKSVPHHYVNAPDSKRAIQGRKVTFVGTLLQGLVYLRTHGHKPPGGLSFYAPGPLNFENAKEVNTNVTNSTPIQTKAI
jgi:hypothetical protein